MCSVQWTKEAASHGPDNKSGTPREAGGLMRVGPPQRRSGWGSRRRALRAFVDGLEGSTAVIRGFLLADVFADVLQFEPDRGHGVAACPEVLA